MNTTPIQGAAVHTISAPLYVVLTAAGSGTRLGSQLPKAFVKIQGVSILERALQTVCSLPGLTGVVVTIPQEFKDTAQRLISRYEPKVLAGGGRFVRAVQGGESRALSVRAGLRALNDFCQQADGANVAPPNSPSAKVLIHDAARALTPLELFKRVADALDSVTAVVPALPVDDTVRLVHEPSADMIGASAGIPNNDLEPAGATLRRSNLRAVQTPQGFRGNLIFLAHGLPVVCISGEGKIGNGEANCELLAAGHSKGEGDVTGESLFECDALDDAMMVSNLGYRHFFVSGSRLAFKITRQEDLEYANFCLGAYARKEQTCDSRKPRTIEGR